MGKYIMLAILLIGVSFVFISLLPIIHGLSRCNEEAFHKSILLRSSVTSSRATRTQCEQSYSAINKLEACYEEVIVDEIIPGSTKWLLSFDEAGLSDYKSVESVREAHNIRCKNYPHVIFANGR
jgi:hypothetical protein